MSLPKYWREWVKKSSLVQWALTESMNTSECNMEIESDQPPLIPDMSPIRRPEEPSLIPYCFLSETKLSVVLDKTQEIILEFLPGSAEIYLARKERSRSEGKFLSNLERKYRNRSKGNKLTAPYKDRKSQIEGMSKPFMRRPIHYSEPKESLFYKETMARVRKTPKTSEKQPKRSGNNEEVSHKALGKLIREAKKAI